MTLALHRELCGTFSGQGMVISPVLALGGAPLHTTHQNKVPLFFGTHIQESSYRDVLSIKPLLEMNPSFT